MRVLIVIDSFNREYLSMKLLEAALESRGAKVRICARQILAMTFNRYKPEVVVIPKTHKITELEIIHKSSVVVLAQAESFSGSEDAFLYFSKNIITKFVDIVNCWGDFDRKFYTENKLFSADQIFVNGHPITESWYLHSPQTANTAKPVVGIAMSIRGLTHKANGRNPSPIALVMSVEDAGDSGYFIPPYHAEDWISYEAAWIRIVYELIKQNTDIKFVLRPHPLEDPIHYQPFLKFDNVAINTGCHISEFLSSIDVLCSAFSTSMLDAYFRQIPVVSLKNLIPNRILECIHPSQTGIPHDKYFRSPDSIAELRNQFHVSWSPIPELDLLGRNVYNYPDNQRPSQRMADTIMQSAPPLLKTKSDFSPMFESRFERLCGPYRWSPSLRLLILQLRDIVKNTSIVSMAYSSHNFLRNRRYASLISRLKNF